MPPPRYHFPSRPTGPALARPNRPGSTLHQREDVADCTFCVSWNGNPPVKFVGGWELPGYVGRLGGGSWELPPGDASRKTLKQRQFFFSFFTGFGRRFGVPCLLVFHLFICVLFLLGGLWTSVELDEVWFRVFVWAAWWLFFHFPPFINWCFGALRFGFWKESIYERDCYELWKRYPYWIPNRAPNPHQLMHPGLHGYMFLFYLYLYIYIYIYYIHIYTVYINKQPILPPIFLQIKWKFLKHGSQFSVSPSRGVHRDNKPSTSLGTCRLGNPGISGITCGPRTPKWV